MKKIVVLLILSSCHFSFGQASFQGEQILEVYGGGPNFMKYDFFGLSTNTISTTGSTSIPPSGFKYSYMISNELSIGVDVLYNSYRQTYLSTDTIFSNNQWNYVTAHYEDFKSRLRIQARFNLLLPTSSPNVDSYFGFAVGTNNRWQQRRIDGVLTENLNSSDLVVIPVSARLCYGFRYFFNYNMALGCEVGLGGPLFSAQFSYKF